MSLREGQTRFCAFQMEKIGKYKIIDVLGKGAMGIVYRALDPDIDREVAINKPHVVDFGIARVEMSTMTQTGVTIGTPSYMSPEQVMGKKIDKRSDIFSLGAILYELVTGKRPFQRMFRTFRLLSKTQAMPKQIFHISWLQRKKTRGRGDFCLKGKRQSFSCGWEINGK